MIIGAGPTGLYATYYAGFRAMSVAVIDSLDELGGQLSALYPEKLIYDVAGLPSVKAQTLVDSLAEQESTAKPLYLLGQTAQDLKTHPDKVVVTTSTGVRVTAKAALITGGIGTFTPRPLPNGAEFLGRGLRYFVPKPDELAGHDVVIAGGGDSAVDWALALEPVARSVTLVHRRDAFRAHERSVEQLRASRTTIRTPLRSTGC